MEVVVDCDNQFEAQ